MQIILKITFLFIFTISPALAFAEADTLAVKSADTFLKGIKLIQLTEGKKMISDNEWVSNNSYPVYTEASTLFEDMFDTDVPSVKGYKRLLEIKVVSKGGTPLLKQYLLISYKNPKTNQWKVFSFTESKDTAYEANKACNAPDTLSSTQLYLMEGEKKYGLARTNYTKSNYSLCGYWSAMAGKLNQAKNAYEKVALLNEQDAKDNIYRHSPVDNLIVLNIIVGK